MLPTVYCVLLELRHPDDGRENDRNMLLISNTEYKHILTNFDVLLTVHLSIILAINQLNAQNLLL